MAHSKTTAGQSRKSHKTRKTVPVSAPRGKTSLPSTALTVSPKTSVNPLTTVLQRIPESLPAQGGGDQPPVPPTLSLLDATTLGKDAQKDEDKRLDGASCATGVPEPLPPQKQWWYRPADSKARKLVEKIVVMDVAGWKSADIAKKLHTTAASIDQYRYIGKKNGWLRINETGEEETVDIEAELAMTVDRKIVRNIDASLDGHMTNWQTHEMTLAAAKGRGIFKGDAAKGVTLSELPLVAIQVIMPPVGAMDQHINEKDVGGTPAYVEGEIQEP